MYCNTNKPPYGNRRRQLGRWDVSIAFFHAAKKGELYARPPTGIRCPAWLWRLLIAIYRSRRASMLFQDHGAYVLVDIGGLVRIKVSPAMFHQGGWGLELLVNGVDLLADAEPEGVDRCDELPHEHFLVEAAPKAGAGRCD